MKESSRFCRLGIEWLKRAWLPADEILFRQSTRYRSWGQSRGYSARRGSSIRFWDRFSFCRFG